MNPITIEDLSPSRSPDEPTYLRHAVDGFSWDEASAQAAQDFAQSLISDVRSNPQKRSVLETLLQRYPLSSAEGLALMQIAEALLRIPDAPTAQRFLEEKLKTARWSLSGDGLSGFMKASGLGLSLGKMLAGSALSKLAMPAMHGVMRSVIEQLGKHFIVGQDIQSATAAARAYETQGYRMSYDMLGEGARTDEDAQRYFDAYKQALDYIAKEAQQAPPEDGLKRPGISVKLSALHPRYEPAHKDRCVQDLTARLTELCIIAAQYGLSLTIDAEETERLCLSLEIFENLLQVNALKDWDGLGLAVQAYQKRALDTLRFVTEKAQQNQRRIQVRLVKGAYWDREIKRAQALGLSDYPVFTRKIHTDLHYLICAQYMLQQTGTLYAMFATHNAHTIAAILQLAKTAEAASGQDFEFQRLHGMGESVYAALFDRTPIPTSVYAPVGTYADLLPYLVRRMLENGANSSFVNQVLDGDVPAEKLVKDPLVTAQCQAYLPHPKIDLPLTLFEGEPPFGRDNSAGKDFNDSQTLSVFMQHFQADLVHKKTYEAASLIDGAFCKTAHSFSAFSPADRDLYNGRVFFADDALVHKACTVAHTAFPKWRNTDTQSRADILLRYADLLESHSFALKSLLLREAGKTIWDAHSEIREAVDFCRYYAQHAVAMMPAGGLPLPGPTGERNLYVREGRGIFVCISPWNFPLAIFTGQIAAALLSGNCVIAKPAEQTNLIAHYAVTLLHKAGVPPDVLQLVLGDGDIGAALVAHPLVTGGVTFTGSTQAARAINQSLATKTGAPIVPFIAETGGQNAMLIDSSALLEQALDHVMSSAFGSAGQRCSALRILYVHEAVADQFVRLLSGAIARLQLGDPQHISHDIGPIIDEDARGALVQHCVKLDGMGKLIACAPLAGNLVQKGWYFAPCAYEVHNLVGLEQEVFGPILHVIRYHDANLDAHLEELNALGYGLTLGIQTRREDFAAHITERVRAGNVYINRSMIGAVVGSQPFGGHGLSGTGPKAGGPDYLLRFMQERAISTDTTAAGGNVSLVSLGE